MLIVSIAVFSLIFVLQMMEFGQEMNNKFPRLPYILNHFVHEQVIFTQLKSSVTVGRHTSTGWEFQFYYSEFQGLTWNYIFQWWSTDDNAFRWSYMSCRLLELDQSPHRREGKCKWQINLHEVLILCKYAFNFGCISWQKKSFCNQVLLCII